MIPGMNATIPSFQSFFARDSFKAGKASLYLVYMCTLGKTGLSKDEPSISESRLVAMAEKTWIDGEIAVIVASAPFKVAILVKLPCGSLKNPFKQGSSYFFDGRLELWAKPELDLPNALKSDVEISSISCEDEQGNMQVVFNF